jgi:hypothetical protein
LVYIGEDAGDADAARLAGFAALVAFLCAGRVLLWWLVACVISMLVAVKDDGG